MGIKGHTAISVALLVLLIVALVGWSLTTKLLHESIAISNEMHSNFNQIYTNANTAIEGRDEVIKQRDEAVKLLREVIKAGERALIGWETCESEKDGTISPEDTLPSNTGPFKLLTSPIYR